MMSQFLQAGMIIQRLFQLQSSQPLNMIWIRWPRCLNNICIWIISNQHNREIVAQVSLNKVISRITGLSTLPMVLLVCCCHWGVIDDLGKGQNGRFQALDGWFLDPRINQVKSKPLVRDESIETKTKEFKTVADYLKDYEFYADRQLNPEFQEWNLRVEWLQRLNVNVPFRDIPTPHRMEHCRRYRNISCFKGQSNWWKITMLMTM